MRTGRLEAFSDGVIAIIITIMVLEMKVPHDANLAALTPMLPVFLSYVLSFIYVGIYWNNHHHMFHAAESVTGSVLWANMHLLFWLSLVPFATGWMGENHFQLVPTLLYGFVLFMAAVAYYILARSLVKHHGKRSKIGEAIGTDRKGRVSMLIYAVAIGSAFLDPRLGLALYVLVALIWLVPDRRVIKPELT